MSPKKNSAFNEECIWTLSDYRLLMPILAFDFLLYTSFFAWAFKDKLLPSLMGKAKFMVWFTIFTMLVQLVCAILIFNYQIKE